jgi:hypothetical protein
MMTCKTHSRRASRRCVLAAALLLLAAPAFARINVVTLPGRDSVQLTIYNLADLTLVKETRVLTFHKGLNRLEFSWANRAYFQQVIHGAHASTL